MLWSKTLFAALILTVLMPDAGAAEDETITLKSLLLEMEDRETLPRFPDPPYTCKQFSSYDRASVSPDDHKTWFANGDRGHHLRVEEMDGRKEWVMMDAEGPGAVVRIWSANPMGTLRVYLDMDPAPVIEAPMADVLDGKWKVPEPLAAVRAKGHNLYLPIPYGKHCKITCDEKDFYYQINYRTYPGGTSVESLTPEMLDQSADLISAANQALLMERKSVPGSKYAPKNKAIEVPPGEAIAIEMPEGPKVCRLITVYPIGHESRESLRYLIFKGTFDGIETIWCPLCDFFGAGAGAEEHQDFYRYFGPGRPWVCLWPMPYKEQAEISVVNLGKEPVKIFLSIFYADWEWDDRSMHFYARWRFEHPIPTRPMRDWNYLEVKGKGIFVGDSLGVINPVAKWWGEGDEKIYVDGETFPSHFGTGTEDYYGYAWCCNEPFKAPLHCQPRCDGFDHGNNWGHTTVGRLRALDGIPFNSDFKFDMEVWHWEENCEVGYAATTYFYAFPGAKHNCEPLPEIAKAPIPEPTPLPPPYRIEGAIECEDMKVIDRLERLQYVVQQMRSFGPEISSNMKQLWVQTFGTEYWIDLQFPVEGTGPHKVTLYASRSWDYGIIQFHINGQPAGDPVDLFNTEGRAVAPTGPIELGIFEPVDGKMVLRAEVVGTHPDSEKPQYYFGLDCVVVTPVEK